MANSFPEYNLYPGTEAQHDFHKWGFTQRIIKGLLDSNENRFKDKIKSMTLMTSGTIPVLTDTGICKKYFGSVATVSVPQGSQPLTPEKTGVVSRKWTRRSDNGKTQNWQIFSVDKDRFEGAELARALQIPDKSVAIVDTDNGIFKRLKMGRVSNYLMYYCINNITRADSALKVNINKDGRDIFSGLKGILCKALETDQTIEVNGRGELKMGYTIKISNNGDDTISQDWIGHTKFSVDDAHKENNREVLKEVICESQGAYDGSQEQLEGMLKKRSGDQFQGWITKNLLTRLTDPVNVYYFFRPAGKNWSLSEQPKVRLASLQTNGQLGDKFVMTGDFPFLCFCIECLGVSVLFKEESKIIYFRRV